MQVNYRCFSRKISGGEKEFLEKERKLLNAITTRPFNFLQRLSDDRFDTYKPRKEGNLFQKQREDFTLPIHTCQSLLELSWQQAD